MGILRRRIAVATRPLENGRREGRAVVEDDFHHFRVSIISQNGVVASTASQSLRTPTVICGMAGDRLSELEGMTLSTVSASVLEQTDARLQCTHMIDLAGLAVAALARGTLWRRYEAEVDDRQPGKPRFARLWRDGANVLTWELDGYSVKAPPAYEGRGLGSGFTGWVRTALPEEEAEAGLVLRRAVFISGGRGVDLDAPDREWRAHGGCWAWQPERAHKALRNVGSTHDFTDRAGELLQEDGAWLAFEEAS